MRKSIILASLLIGSSSFAVPVTFNLFNSQPPFNAGQGMCGESDPRGDLATYGWDTQCETQFMVTTCSGDIQNTNEYQVICGTCGAGTTLTSINGQQICRPNSCSPGFSVDAYGMCSPTPPTTPDPNHPLGEFDNDEQGCISAGGYWFGDFGGCYSLSEAKGQTFGNPDPDAVKGAFISIAGIGTILAGIGLLPYSGGASGALVSAGIHATLNSVGMMMFSNNDAKVTNGTSSASKDVSTSQSRIKISLNNSSGGSQSSIVTKSNPQTGKVEKIVSIPPKVHEATKDPSYINQAQDGLSKPLPLL